VTDAPLHVRVEGEAIVGEVWIEAPPEQVFRALTDPLRLREWWGSRDTYWVEEWTADVRVGGSWEARCQSAAGLPSRVHGVYLELDPPHRLAYTWNPSWDGSPETTVRFELVRHGERTHVRMRHDGFGAATAARENHVQGWPAVLGWLRSQVESEARPAVKEAR
jgi:uncharacterized protein YndB with AHSA1/START domain